MSWNIKTPGDYINGPLTVAGVTQFNSNIGVGITPNAWASTWKGGQFGRLSLVNTATDSLVGHNFYNDGAYRFVANDFATYYDQVNGGHVWGSSVTSGTAGNTITWSVLATLNAAGLLTLNRATAGVGLEVFNSTTYSQIRLQSSGTNQSSYLTFNPTGTGKAVIQMNNIDRLFLDTNGNLGFLSGRGIDFSSDSNAAGMTSEILNDYEEGTWVGTLKGGTTDPTTPITATGRYTKIGRQVNIQIAITGVDTTGASGSVQITGIPFAPGLIAFGVLQSEFGITFTGTLGCYINATATTIIASASTSSGGRTDGTHNAGTNRWFWLNMTYSV